MTRERVAPGDAGDGDRRPAPGVDQLQVVGRRVGGDARVLELDGHPDDVVLHAHPGDPQRVAAEVDARAGRAVVGVQVAVRGRRQRGLQRRICRAGHQRGQHQAGGDSQGGEDTAGHVVG